MKVRELMDMLANVDPETLVVMSKDGEGNGHSPLSDLSNGVYIADNTWSGELRLNIVDREAIELEVGTRYSDEDFAEAGVDGAVACVCLWPTN